MNIFFALKGSKLFIIICCHCSWMLCSVAAVKVSPHSSIVQFIFYVCPLGSWNIYSESSELIIGLDLFSKQI